MLQCRKNARASIGYMINSINAVSKLITLFLQRCYVYIFSNNIVIEVKQHKILTVSLSLHTLGIAQQAA